MECSVRHHGDVDVHPLKTVLREDLPSGRIVHIDRKDDNHVVVRVGGVDGWAAVTLPVRSFPFFGKTLAQRIREAIIKLDVPIEMGQGPDVVEQAVEAALFHGGPLHEGANYAHREPPLIRRMPPSPPPPSGR